MRPSPPREALKESEVRPLFMPAPELDVWVKETFLDEESALYNDEHEHLLPSTIGYLWTNVTNTKNMRRIVGTAEIPNVQGSRWVKARAESQLWEWFGGVPDFLITLDAFYAESTSDTRFCALVEHELYHCAQCIDSFGDPLFSRTTGLPVYGILGHDVEEFVGIVRRYGPAAAAGGTKELVDAALHHPQVSEEAVDFGCGTCLR